MALDHSRPGFTLGGGQLRGFPRVEVDGVLAARGHLSVAAGPTSLLDVPASVEGGLLPMGNKTNKQKFKVGQPQKGC